MKQSDRAYLAGILDGEGSISLVAYTQVGESRRRKGGYSLAVQVVNRSEELIVWLADRFGGTTRHRDRGGNRVRIYEWQVHGRNCGPVLEAALPYLVVKRIHAEIALEFIETINLHSSGSTPVVNDEVAEHRAILSTAMRGLNVRGPR